VEDAAGEGPGPADRRAKLIVPTERGRQRICAGDQIIAGIESVTRPSSAEPPTPGSSKPSAPSPQTSRTITNPTNDTADKVLARRRAAASSKLR
jgi:hypothetical protein